MIAPRPDVPPVLLVGTHSIHVRRFAAGLCAAGQPVVIVTDRPEPLLEHALVLDQVQVDFSVRRLGTAAVIRRCITRWAPRVVHAHQANSVAWHAARACRGGSTPLVITIWGSDVLSTPHEGFLKRQMVRSALRSAALWTADAAGLLRVAAELAQVDRPTAHVVMGLDRVPDDLSQIWPDKQDWVLSCRLHKPLYRIDAVIAGFCMAAERRPQWRLEVAATGTETEALRRMAADLSHGAAVVFTGMLSADQLERSYRRSTVYVSFPDRDGTSVSLLEAMAHGCVPVVSDLPANREWIVDGTNGFVVGGTQDLAVAIERAIHTGHSARWRSETAEANRRRVADEASFAVNIDQFLAQYARLGR